nr:MAG TPA: hypothetical protein [Caudoviricetes sp.]
MAGKPCHITVVYFKYISLIISTIATRTYE